MIYGIDYSKEESRITIVRGHLEAIDEIVGKMPRMIIIDEISHVSKAQRDHFLGEFGYSDKAVESHHDWLLSSDYPKPEQPPVDPSMVKKNGKMVKRHHPVPTTPRSPRKR